MPNQPNRHLLDLAAPDRIQQRDLAGPAIHTRPHRCRAVGDHLDDRPCTVCGDCPVGLMSDGVGNTAPARRHRHHASDLHGRAGPRTPYRRGSARVFRCVSTDTGKQPFAIAPQMGNRWHSLGYGKAPAGRRTRSPGRSPSSPRPPPPPVATLRGLHDWVPVILRVHHARATPTGAAPLSSRRVSGALVHDVGSDVEHRPRRLTGGQQCLAEG
jgi:hypothetical protein